MARIEDFADRIEANLKTRRTLGTPLGKVRLAAGHQVTTRDQLFDSRAKCPNWFPFHHMTRLSRALVAGVSAVRGWLFKEEAVIAIEVCALEYPISMEASQRRDMLEQQRRECLRRIGGSCRDIHVLTVLHTTSPEPEKSIEYVRNDPPGTGFAHSNLHIVIAGPEHGNLVMGSHDALAHSLRWIFRGRTDAEDEVLVRGRIEEALTEDGVAVIGRIARDVAIERDFVLRLARGMAASASDLYLDDVGDAGPVLRRRH